MSQILTDQDFANAKRDISDIDKAVNTKSIVDPRWGGDFKSLPLVSEEWDAKTQDAQNTINDWQQAINTIVVDDGVPALAVSTANGSNQQEINDFGGALWRDKAAGYSLNARVILDNGDIVKSTIYGNTNDPNTDMTGWDFDDDSVSNINKLRLKSAKKGNKVYLISVNEGQGEGGGEFIATQKSGLVDDGGLVVSSPDPLLFWVRINYDYVTPEMFGAIAYRYASGAPNYTPTHVDCADAIQKAVSSGKPVKLSSGVYNIYKPILHNSHLKISGEGMERSVICKRTNTTANTGNPLYDVDAIFVANGKYVGYVEFDSFQIGKIWDENWLPNYLFKGTAYHAPYLEQSSFKNFRASGTKYGLYSINIYMTNWIKCSFSASSGLVLGGLLTTEVERGGTTNNFEDCWVKHVYDAGAYAWNTYNIATSTIKNCSTDVLGKAGSVTTELCAGGVFNFVKSSFNIVGYGCEAAHATGYLKASEESMITISNLSAYDFFNRYGGSSSFLFDLSGASRLEFSNAKWNLAYNSNEAGLPTPNFMRVGTRCNARVSNVMMYPRVPSAVNTSTGFDIIATDNAHVVVENDNSRIEYSIGQPNNTALTVPAINTTNRGIQSSSTSQDFGLVGSAAGKWNTSRLRIGDGRIYRAADGVPYFASRQPTGDWDGVPMIGASYGAGVAGNPLPCQLHFNTATNQLMMRTANKWFVVSMTELP